MKRDAATILVFILIVYPVVVWAAHYTQSYAIFQSRGAFYAPPKGFDIDEVMLMTPDGEQLHAWWLQTSKAKNTVLFFQGNGTNISHKTHRLNTLHKMGVNGLLIDYRGYGRSSGRIKCEQDIYRDGSIAWDYLVYEKGVAPEEIIIWGRSLGGGVAAEIAQFKEIAGLVLESTFYSLDDIARRQYWFLPTTRLLEFHFDNGRKLKNVSGPVVIIHSVEDDYIPFFQAGKLFDSASNPKFIIKTTGSHADSFDRQWVVFGSNPDRSGGQDNVLSVLMKCLAL